jgi:glycosyltransferase involved in cell wall biosynthesis
VIVDQAGHPERTFEPEFSVEARAASIEIALATYNSAPYLRELLDSLFRQTCQDFTILVSDDGSSDATLHIIADYQHRFPGRIRRVGSGERVGGPRANYSRLIDHLTADYVLFCDHDDVWLPSKVALSLAHMQSLEARHGSSTPLLVHTDLVVVGPDLETFPRPSSGTRGSILPRTASGRC